MPAASATKRPRLLVLYGSETGTAQDAADRVGREAARRGWVPAVLPADGYALAGLPTETAVVFVVATAGQGDPPANLRPLWRFVMRAALPAGCLAPLPAAVFGLGDSGYAEFNVVAKKLAARLAQLGAARVAAPAYADAAARGGVDAALDAWLPSLWAGLRAAGLEPPCAGPRPPDDDVDGGGGAPRFVVEVVDAPPPAGAAARAADDDDAAACAPPWHDVVAVHAAFAALDAAAAGGEAPPGCGPATARGRGPARPATATVVANDRTTAASHFQDVRHIRLALDPPTPFLPGDVAAFLPRQRAASVAALLARAAVPPRAIVRVTAPAAPPGTPPVVATAAALVAGVLELDGAPPRRRAFAALAAHAPPGTPAAARLAEFGAPGHGDDLDLYCTAERRSLAEVLADFPSAAPPLGWLLTVGPRLRPRRFSIASWTVDGSTVDLAVAVVDWRSPHGRRVRGLASTDAAAWARGDAVPAWVESGSLPLPRLDVPLVLVGPGTGVAPMRSILQHRAAAAAAAAARGAPRPPPCLLFVGCRSRAADCHFEADWDAALADGTLGRLVVAASRDGPAKFYVSHAIETEAAAVWRALGPAGGGVAYVAGAAGAMPAGVRRALERVAMAAGGLGEGEARAWVRRLVAERRLCEETWA